MCSANPPPPPDYVAQGQAQGEANIAAARQQGIINNPNVINPGNQRTVTWDASGQPTITNNLSPDELEIYNRGVTNRQGLGNLAGQGIDSLGGIIGKPVDLSGVTGAGQVYKPGSPLTPSATPQTLNRNALPGMPDTYQGAGDLPDVSSGEDTRNRVIQAMLSRSNEDINQRQDQQQSDLVARGIAPGSEAYQREMDTLSRQRNDARTQAEIAGGDAAAQVFGMDSARRGQIYGEGTTDASLIYSQGMGQRSAAMGEQGQQFGQELSAGQQNFAQRGQASQLNQSQQAQQNTQQNELRRQQIAELITQRQMPLNEITALMSGTQVGGSQAAGGGSPGGYNTSNVAPAPNFAASQAGNQYQMDVYNQQAAQANQNNQAMTSAAMMAAMYMF